MKKFILFVFCIGLITIVKAQYSVSQNVDRLFYCNSGSVMRETGKVQSFNSNTFKGFIYHFYYYSSGVYTGIGNFTATIVGGSFFTSYGNLNPSYFDGSRINNVTKVLGTSSTLWLSIDIPYTTFPNNNTGQQLVMDVEAIDQFGNTTTHSNKTVLSVPLLYTNPVILSTPNISAPATVVCASVTTQLVSSPNYASYGFTYDWYKDGSVFSLGDNTGALTVSAAGNYYAIVSDACQTASSNTVVINAGTVPGKPTISLPVLPLCNGASGTMTANGSGGTYTWSTGTVANTLSVTAAGNYTVHESNGCGAGPESNPVTITTASSAVAPNISSSNGTLLCNGASTILSTTPSSGGTIYWNTGATGNSITVNTAGNYYAYEVNSCGNSANSNTITISTNNTAPAPTLSLSGNMTLCNGFGQVLSTSPSTSGGVIHWSNGATGNSITISTAGTYYAWESNVCGNSPNSITLNINTLNTPAAPFVTPVGPLALCNGTPTTLSSTGTVAANILWYFNGSSTGHFGSTYAINAPGNYSTSELSACGTSPSSNTVNIITNSTPPAPSLNVSGTILLCDGTGQTISGSPATGGGVLHWSTGATGNSITVTSPGNYYAWESNTSCGSGPNSATVTITNLNKPPAPTVNPPSNQLLCNGASATLTSSGSNTTWSNGTTGNTLVVSSTGNYFAVDHNACGNSANSNVVAITTGNCPIPAPGTSFFICPGKTKLIDAGAGYDSYLWNTGATTQTITVGPGTYSVTVMKNGCAASSAIVTVSYYTVGTSFISASGPTSFCAGNAVILSSSIGSSYLWSNGATTKSIVVNASGSYSVMVTDANGCMATSGSVTTVVNPLPNASISGSTTICQNSTPPAITFNGSGGTAPYAFTYKLNNGANQTITTTSGNSISINVPTSSVGTYTYSLVGVSESSGTTCSNNVIGSATVVVNPLPSATISGTATICQFGSSPAITFTGSGATPPYTFTYKINGGINQTISTVTGSSVSINVPTSAGGLFTYTLISVQESGVNSCVNTANGSASVLVNSLPTATIAGNNSVCQNSGTPQIIFTGSSGTQPYTFSYKINGGSVQTIYTTTGNSVAVDVPTNSAGTFIYSLISVQESSGTSCGNSASGNATVIVNPLPTATIVGSTSVCQNSSAPAITFTGSGAIAPYTFIYKINGGVNQTITTTSGNSISVSVPTSVAGIFTYSLVSVQESGINSCINSVSGSATVTVNQIADATIGGSANICQNAPSPLISFTGTGGTVPYTFIYKINGGTNQTITTTSGNTATVSVPTTTSGYFTYSLVSVQESSSTACTNTASGSATVVISQLPTATIAGNTTVCQNSSSPQITLSSNSGIAPFIFTYKINGGANQTVSTSSSSNAVTVSVPTATAGTFIYTLVSIQESGISSCVNNALGSATVVVNPLPTAMIAGTTSVCQNSAAPTILFTGNGATAPYTFTFNINGGTNQTVTTIFGNSVSISAPTNIPGSYVYHLVSVEESSGTTCINTANDSATITVNPLPIATIAGTVSVCQYGVAPSITFTGTNAKAPFIFTYKINNGTSQTVTTTTGNTVTISAPTNSPGIFTYTLISVQESDVNTCVNTATGSAVVTVNTQPAKAILAAPNLHLCNGQTGIITVTNYTTGFTYTWYKDGLLFTTTSLDTIHITVAGNYTVMVTSDKGCDAATVSDPIGITTGSVATPVITGYLHVCPQGKTRLVVNAVDNSLTYDVWKWAEPPDKRLLSGDSIFSALAGQYQVWVSKDGCADSVNVTVTADDTVYPAGKLIITPNHIPYGGSATFTAEVTDAMQYQWDIGNGNTINSSSNAISQNYYLVSDSLPIRVKAISERNCITTFNGFIKVDPAIIDSIPNHSFIGNLKDWNVFPIPFHQELKVSVILKRNETVRMDLFTMDGRWVRSWQYVGRRGENLFSLNNLENLTANVFYLITGIYNSEKHFEKLYKY